MKLKKLLCKFLLERKKNFICQVAKRPRIHRIEMDSRLLLYDYYLYMERNGKRVPILKLLKYFETFEMNNDVKLYCAEYFMN